jgi:hypothetical protein
VRALLHASWAPLAVFLLHCVASLGLDAYDRVPWFDVPMHVLGGLAIAHFFDRGLTVILPDGGRTAATARVERVLIVSLVCTAAVLWEFAEFVSDRLAGTDSQVGLQDTLGDLLAGMLAGLVYVVLRGARGGHPRCAPPESR